jgi:hypothetical protein
MTVSGSGLRKGFRCQVSGFGVQRRRRPNRRPVKLKKTEEWIPFLRKKLDRITRIGRIMRPSAERPLAAGEKKPDNPVNPV